MMVEYRPEQIAEIIKAEKEDWKIGILPSGDIGFFSGAKKLEKVLEGFADEVILVPGISSPASHQEESALHIPASALHRSGSPPDQSLLLPGRSTFPAFPFQFLSKISFFFFLRC